MSIINTAFDQNGAIIDVTIESDNTEIEVTVDSGITVVTEQYDDTQVKRDIANLQVGLSNETTTREGADLTLQENIDSVSGDLLGESEMRIAGDAHLQEQIDNMPSPGNINIAIASHNASTTAHPDIRQLVSTEASDRASADTTLQGNIDSVSGDLSSEVTNRRTADTNLQNQIDNLPTSQDITSAVTTHNSSNTAHTDIRNLVSAEVTNRTNGDRDLQNQINALPSSQDITTAVSNHNSSNVAHSDIRQLVSTEATNRENADEALQDQIDALTGKSDVVDIVGTYQDLLNYDTSTLGENDIVKVLNDSTHDNAMTYYRWLLNTWNYVGSEGSFYTKAESDLRYTPQTRTVNGKPLSSNITLDYTDVGALSDTTNIPSKTSDLTNDSGFITSSALPTKTSDLTNDSGFITSSALPTKTSDLTNDSDFQTGTQVSSAISNSLTWGNIGGTLSNQTDLQSALDNKANKKIEINVTLLSASWSSDSYTISNASIPASTDGDITITYPILTETQARALAGAFIIPEAQVAGSLTLKALNGAPTIDIPIQLLIEEV